MRNRTQKAQMIRQSASLHGRIIILSGARQTGKTTLVKKSLSDYTYLSIEDPVLRADYLSLTANQWEQIYPRAILDEVQKAPALIESIKAVYDQSEETRYILLGSSQMLLLEKVRESLAGRTQIIELFPLTLPELLTKGWGDPVEPSFLQKLVSGNQPLSQHLPGFKMHDSFVQRQKAFDHYLSFGGYPAISSDRLSEEERWLWLQNYIRTYLERDIRDLAEFRQLEPFVNFQKITALQTGQTVNFSQLAKQIGVTGKTAQRFLQYMSISYQTILLQPWHRNQMKRLVKSPKLHYLDPGVLRAILKKRGIASGPEFESAVVSEIYKQLKVISAPVEFYHLRSHDGREVDLLIELETGYLAIEIKMTAQVSRSDFRHLRDLDQFLGKPLLAGILLSNDPEIKDFGLNTYAFPAAYFLT